MHLEEFAAGASLLHRLDPRIKIITAFAFSLVTALADRFTVLGPALAGAVVLVLAAGLDRRLLLIRLALVNTFIIFLWLFLPFSQPGQAVWQIGPLTATREGLLLCLIISIKSNAIIIALMALLSTSRFISLVHALHHLKAPDKLVHLCFFTFRYFQVIHQEYLRLRAAMRVRCFRPRTDRHTYRSLAQMLGMILVRSFDRSERVYQAMLCRGFQGQFWVLHHFHLHGRDLIFLAVMLLFTMILALGQWTNLLL